MSTDIPTKVPAMVSLEKSAPFTRWEYELKPEGKGDVTLKVLYNGICGTDKHMQNNDWGLSRYPLVPGHEIIGEVVSTGSDVSDLPLGTVVGLGCIAQTCGTCSKCTDEERDNLCNDRKFTYFDDVTDETGTHRHRGGFSSYIRTPANKVIVIPKEIDHAEAGPLMCAGVTTFTPIYEWTKDTADASGKTVGVVGVGGLGSLAIQFAAKMGAEVVALSRSDKKKEFTTDLGATRYIVTSDEEDMKANAQSIDFLIVCISGGDFDPNPYFNLLRPYGVLHFVGVPQKPLTFMVQPLMFQRLSISSSPIGSTEQCRTMLNFAAKHNIRPLIEKFPHSKANEAMQKVIDGTIRFRAVLVNDLLD